MKSIKLPLTFVPNNNKIKKVYFKHDRVCLRPVCKHSDARLFNIIQYLIIYNHYNKTIIQVPTILIPI